MSAASQSGKSLYYQDLVIWATQTAQLLREGAVFSQDERELIAEEIYEMASRDRRKLKNLTVSLVMHLLKIEYQPEKRTRSWDVTVLSQRRHLRVLLEDSPSLSRVLDQELPNLYDDARQAAKTETGIDLFPERNPFTVEQILRG